MQPHHFEEEIFFATVRLEAVAPNSPGRSVGTGFVLQYPIPGTSDQHVLLLVTCKHVLFGGRGVITFRFCRRNPESPDDVSLGSPFIITARSHSQCYHDHDDPDVDIAVINISGLIKEHREAIYYKYIPIEYLASMSLDELMPGQEVLFVGYPIGIFDPVNNLPILRSGRIATIPRVDFGGQPKFLIDAHVYPGSSGSAVFVRVKDKYSLVGMFGQAITRTVPVKMERVATQPAVQDFIGLGVVYKPAAILEVAQEVAQNIAR